MRSQAQYTIHSLNDVIASTTAPTNPYKGQLWVDTSQSPPITKVYNGSAWKEQNGTDTLRSNITTLTTKQSTFQTNLNGLTSDVSAIATRVETVESDTEVAQENILALQEDVSALYQTASEISAEVSNKADAEYGSSSSSFGWKLKSDGFFLYSGATTVMSVTTSGLSVSGTITASSGTIGGFTIAASNLHTGSKTSYSSSTTGVFLGTTGIGLGAGAFYVTSGGSIYARSGTIGGFTLNSTYIYSGSVNTDNYVMIGSNANSRTVSGVTLSNWGLILGTQFGVTRSGTLYCSDVHLTGEITATSGTFDNCTLNESCTIYGYIYCSGSDSVKFYGTKVTLNYETWIGGAGIISDIYIVPKNGSTQHTSYSYIRPYGSIVCPYNYAEFADDGMIFGIMEGPTYNTQNLLCGVSFYYSNDGNSNFYSEALFRVGDKQFLDATMDSANGWIVTWGTATGMNGMQGAWYPDMCTSSYICSVYGANDVYYGCLYGRWYIEYLYVKDVVQGYITSTTVNSTAYPYLYGTWYANILKIGVSTTSYNMRIDSDQITWYYGTTQVGELESYSSYVDVQGTFKTNGNNWISSSDARVKNSITDFTDAYDVLFDNLKPRLFKYNKGTSNRIHSGFIVQETLEALRVADISTSDFAAVCAFGDPADEGTEWGLRYDEIISLNTWEIQKLKARIAELKNKIKIMEDSQ